MASYRSFLFPGAEIGGDFIVLEPRESHHLVRVLRARAGERIVVLDGRGGRFFGSIERADAKAVRVAVERVDAVPPRRAEVTLLQALPKGKTMDLILRIATEIGASSVQPVFTDQSEVQIKGERLESKVEKWRVTMIESCKQCGLAYLPALLSPVPLRDWVASASLRADTLGIVASLEAGSRPLWETLASAGAGVVKIVVAVGPEGDFSPSEYALLKTAGFLPVRLGRNVLRAETAAAYLLSVVDQSLNRGEGVGDTGGA